MKYCSTLITVTDMDRSKAFYHDLLGLNVEVDFGANVTLTGGIALQTADTWTGLIQKPSQDLTFGHNTGELYFETRDFDGFLRRLERRPDVTLVHPVVEQPWGQRAIRFYDPDRHMIEVGEDLVQVVGRFRDQGMTPAEIATRMDVPVDFVAHCLGLLDDTP